MDADQTTYVVDNLETDQVYKFSVHAENEAGLGPGLLLHTPVRVRQGIGEYMENKIIMVNVTNYCLVQLPSISSTSNIVLFEALIM